MLETKRIFLSSTGADLHDHRKVILDTIGLINGVQAVGMERFGPHDRQPLDTCKEYVLSSDIFIGLIGFHFGASPDGYAESYTQLEYLWAAELERLIWLAPKGALLPQTDQSGENLDKQQKFRNALLSGNLITTVENSPDVWRGTYQLANSVLIALFRRLRPPGYSEEQHRAVLQLREREIREDLEAAQRSKSDKLQESLTEQLEHLRSRLSDARNDYSTVKASLDEAKEKLKRLGNQVAYDQMHEALRSLDDGNTYKAERLFESVAESWRRAAEKPNANAATAHYEISKIIRGRGEYLEAVGRLEEACMLDRRNSLYWTDLALCLANLLTPKGPLDKSNFEQHAYRERCLEAATEAMRNLDSCDDWDGKIEVIKTAIGSLLVLDHLYGSGTANQFLQQVREAKNEIEEDLGSESDQYATILSVMSAILTSKKIFETQASERFIPSRPDRRY